MDDADTETPALSDQALYLITELALLLRRTDITTWPRHQADLLRRRLDEINARLRTPS